MQVIADFLDVPLVQVMILSDAIAPGDFVVRRDAAGEADRMFEHMRSDPQWRGVAPSPKKCAEMDLDTKMLVAALYERICHTSFLSTAKVHFKQ